MSDPKSSYGEPVDEPNDVDPDVVVGRAHEGLADAEAAQRDVAAVPVTDAAAPRVTDEPDSAVSERAVNERVANERLANERLANESVASEPVADKTSDSEEIPWYERDDIPMDDDEPTTVAPTTVAATPVAPAEPVRDRDYDRDRDRDYDRDTTPPPAEAAAPAFTPSQQPIFVQAPEAPRPRGNRGAAGAIGLLAAVAFAILYLAAWLGLELIYRGITFTDVPEAALGRLATWAHWVPVVAFFLGFWLLGAFINRGRWGHWVVWGLLVGLAAYGGHLLGQLFQAPFWLLTAREGATLIEEQALAPLAIVAFVLGRELTIWFGAWVAARGRRATELNDAAQLEYERTLEAGPKLQQA